MTGLVRTLLELVPDDRVRAALAAYDRWAPVIEENAAAVQAARAELEASGNPIAAVRAFAAATSTPLDDAAAAELERAVVRVLELLDVTCAAGVWLSEREPAIRAGVDGALKAAFGVAYQAATWRWRLWGMRSVPQ